MFRVILFGLFHFSLAASSLHRREAPSVTFSNGTAVGSTTSGIDTFNGIPFAQPPTGELRLKPPRAINSSLGTFDATGTPTACPQFLFSLTSDDFVEDILGYLEDTYLAQLATDTGEDCLTLNIQRPSGTNSSSNLPVLFWIYGGAFLFGSTQTYDGSALVTKSIDQDLPIIYVAVNYRVGGFGFMPGKEILDDGDANIGLLDQRLGTCLGYLMVCSS